MKAVFHDYWEENVFLNELTKELKSVNGIPKIKLLINHVFRFS